MKKFIWLIGENECQTMNNNSYYFWKHSVSKDDEILKYYVVKKTKTNKQIYKSLSKEEKKYVVWQNSYKHWKLYLKANLFYVSLSYKDVMPSKLLIKNCNMQVKTPIIYLQHGTLAIKKLGYDGTSYNNNMFKFIIYNKSIMEQFSKENDFKKYQLYYGKYHPRYMELVKRQNEIKVENQILWFITWREEFDNDANGRDQLLLNIKRIISNEKIHKFQKENRMKIKICLHSLFTENQVKYLLNNLDSNEIEIVYSSKIDVMDEIVKSKVLITDYSSLGFDFTFLNKPVILFQPDIETYTNNRELYCSMEELNKYNITSSRELIEEIINQKYKINEFFKKRLPSKIDYDYVLSGKHIDRMYDDFKEMQVNSVTFIGYNFYGRGGTVSATYALAEGLLEKGYLVYLLSLKQTCSLSQIEIPYGLNVNSLYRTRPTRKIEYLKRLMIGKWHYSYFKYDSNVNYLIPYTGYSLKKYLKKTKVNTIVSTRETVHFFLKNSNNDNIKNKIYFFHTDAGVVDKTFPGVINKLNSLKLEKCAFVTEMNRQKYIENLNFTNYNDYIVVGNSLTSNTIIEKEDIHTVSKKKVYHGIYLTRISKDRAKDLNNALEFARYLKENKIDNIVIDIFGKGDYVDKLDKMIYDEELDFYLNYKGSTTTPHEELIKHDFAIDFSLNQSFGMTYIEGILNGLKTFAYHNYGSDEVLKEIPDSFIESNEDLVRKINNLPNIAKDELIKNYDIIFSKFSKEVVADKFIKLVRK